MKRVLLLIYIAFLLTATLRCIVPYDIELTGFDQVVVVDGVVTTQFKKHKIILGYTFPIEYAQSSSLQGAQVWVEDNVGTMYNFIENSPGEYYSELEFAARDDRDYQLFFKTEEGKLYQSDKNRPISSPPIDSIFNRYADIIPSNSSEQENGIQFFLDSHDPAGSAKHFRYEWEETYKIVTPYTSVLQYDIDRDEVIERETPINICYSGNTSTALILGTSVGSSVNRIAEMPIRFVSGETDILRNRYSILVRQFAVNNGTYNYYQRIKDSERRGSLFDEQQGSVIGNVSSVDNPAETVLGNFEVSGVSVKRVFFDFADLDEQLLFPYRYSCTPDKIVGTSRDSLLFYVQRGYNILTPPVLDADPQITLGLSYCTDCTTFASSIKPDFWID
jgi:hypothetical protein